MLNSSIRKAARLHYVDWLRVIATLGVFLFHVTDIFNTAGFEIKNAEQSEVITIIQGFFFPWGMPLFFFIAGVGSYFALRRRTAGQFTRERTLRLLVPFLTGTFLLGPIQIYFSWRHRVETGVIDWTLREFVAERLSNIGPKLFGAIGYHMWFLGYLFAFSLLALPLFIWLRNGKGRQALSRLAELCEHRGGILLFILPLVVVRLALQPFFPLQHDWADFFSFGLFFVLGYLVFMDERFTRAIRRDWWILLGVGLVATLAFGLLVLSLGSFDLEAPPRTPPEFLLWAFVAAAGWCGTAFMLFVGMRYLDHDSPALRYGQSVILPFFVLHQTVLLAIAYFVVQWQASLLVKLLIVGLGSFAVSLGLTEYVIKRVPFLQAMFGMKSRQEELSMDRKLNFPLWLRWVGANSVAEVIGLGATLAIDFVILWRVATAQSLLASVAGILLVSASGAIEGSVVGLLQWSVLRRPFPGISRRAWVTATIIGAVVAWFFGSLPSTLMDVGGQQTEAAASEPETATVLLLAAAMGLILGFILGYPQWRVLRRALNGAWLWIPANSLAWALGMPAVFAAIDLAQRSTSLAGVVLTLAVGLFLTGAVVGAVHGLALLWLASPRRPQHVIVSGYGRNLSSISL